MTQRYDLIVWDRIPQKHGKPPKTVARRVGNAKDLDNGSVACYLAEGIALTGYFTVTPWEEKEAKAEIPAETGGET